MSKLYAHLTEEDQMLMNAIEHRDKRLFEVLYKKYYSQLYAVAYRYVGKPQVAEEIVHDVFIKIWNKADQLHIQHSMKSYLFKSTVNSALNFIKKEKADTEKQQSYLFTQEESSEEDGIREEEEVLLADLEKALALLPDKCRQVMYLSRFGKLKQQEIALQMDISIKTVKNHLTYGFQKLREHMEKHKRMIITVVMLLSVLGQ